MRINPLIIEATDGLTRTSRAQMDYVLYLFLLATTVFIWWPKHSLTETLQRQDPPDTLLAALMVFGALLAYYSVRAGAEEILLDGQNGIRDWAVGSDLSLPRILLGYLSAQLLHSVHLVVLALPIILLAFHISGGQWPALCACLAMTIWQAMFYRLTAAIIYVAIGEHGALTMIGVRVLLVTLYLLSAFTLPTASHLVLTATALDGGSSTEVARLSSEATRAVLQFMTIYSGLSACALVILHRQLSHLRAQRAHELPAS